MAPQFLLLGLLAITCSIALAVDLSPLQDFCVSETNSSVFVNGLTCKNPTTVVADDFFLSGLHLAGNISNAFGSRVTQVSAKQLPGLNSLGISMVRLDLGLWGVNPPHIHPRASEIITVLQGTVEAGFITSNPDNKLFKKVLEKGDVFVFPQGLVHFQRNVGTSDAVLIGALNSQNPGVITIGNAVFGSNPMIPSDLLAKAFQTDEDIILGIQSMF